MRKDVPMAWIVKIPPSPRYRRVRWQVRYQDGPHERSAGIFPTRPEALTVKHAIERGEPAAATEPEPGRTTMLFGAYATQVWWPAWSPTRPRSARIIKTKVNNTRQKQKALSGRSRGARSLLLSAGRRARIGRLS
jgi:hypothetical protein